MEPRAKTRAQLGKNGPRGARQRGLARVNIWRGYPKDAVWAEARLSVLHHFHMNPIHHLPHLLPPDLPARQVRRDFPPTFGAERLLYLPVAGKRRSDGEEMKRVIGMERASEKLSRKETEMLVDWQKLSLGVEVVDG